MEIMQVIGIAVLGTALLALLRHGKSELAVLVSLAIGVVLFLGMVTRLTEFVATITDLTSRVGISGVYMTTVLRVVGVAYLAGFGAQICRDAGEGAIASKVELVGKVLIMTMAMPVVMALLELVLRILPQ